MSMKQTRTEPVERITWSNERRKLADLIPWERNPRQIEDAQAERLVDSVETFGQVETLAIGPGNALYNGHQRVSVLAAQYGPDYEVDVRVASRPLTEKEREQLTVYLHKGAAGDWDWVALAEWDYTDLTSWGFDSAELDEMFAELEPEPGGVDTSLVKDSLNVGEQFGVIIICPDAAEQERVYNEMLESGYTVRVVSV